MAKNLDDQDSFSKRVDRLGEIMAAGRKVYAAVDAVDYVISNELGIHRNDLRCLNLLEDGPLSPREIGQRIGLTSGSVTALIDRLEKAGFVERQRSKEDRRSVKVYLSEQSFGQIAKLYQTCGQAVSEAFKMCDDNELKTSAKALNAFAAALKEAAEGLSTQSSD